MQAHSYTGRIAPDLPFNIYLPKPGTQPRSGYRETEKPVSPSWKEQHSQRDSKPAALTGSTKSAQGRVPDTWIFQ